MPSTPESNLRLELQATGENAMTWGTKTNSNLELLSQAIAGAANVNVGGSGNYTLVVNNYASDEARAATLVLTGTLTGNRDIIVPTSPKHYNVLNQTTGAFTLTIRQSAGSGVVVPNGASQIFCTSTTCVNPFGGPPVGSVMEYFGPTAPIGWLVANGAAVSRTVYAALFALLGTTHGAGDGSTTFNLPNRVDRFGVGAGWTYPLGSYGGTGPTTSSAGSHSHGAAVGGTVLTEAQLPSHTHGGVTDLAGNHSHGNVPKQISDTDRGIGNGSAFSLDDFGQTDVQGLHSHSFTSNSAGGNQSHDHSIAADGSHTHTVTPYYLAANYIIKT